MQFEGQPTLAPFQTLRRRGLSLRIHALLKSVLSGPQIYQYRRSPGALAYIICPRHRDISAEIRVLSILALTGLPSAWATTASQALQRRFMVRLLGDSHSSTLISMNSDSLWVLGFRCRMIHVTLLRNAANRWCDWFNILRYGRSSSPSLYFWSQLSCKDSVVWTLSDLWPLRRCWYGKVSRASLNTIIRDECLGLFINATVKGFLQYHPPLTDLLSFE